MKRNISAFEKFFCRKKSCQYIAISNFVWGGGGVLFYFIPEPNKDINIFPFPHLWTFIILFLKEKKPIGQKCKY